MPNRGLLYRKGPTDVRRAFGIAAFIALTYFIKLAIWLAKATGSGTVSRSYLLHNLVLSFDNTD